MRHSMDYINVIDFESTCWKGNPPEGEQQEIIEFGITQFAVRQKSGARSEGVLITPQYSRVSQFCTELTTLTQEELDKQGYHFLDALAYLEREFKLSKRPWCSWGDHDRRAMARNCKLYNVRNPLEDVPHFNLKVLFSIKHSITKGIGMSAALKIAGIEPDGVHHRGVDDSRNIAKLLRHVLS